MFTGSHKPGVVLYGVGAQILCPPVRRQEDSHRVPVEIGVESWRHHGGQPDDRSFPTANAEGLYAVTVKAGLTHSKTPEGMFHEVRVKKLSEFPRLIPTAWTVVHYGLNLRVSAEFLRQVFQVIVLVPVQQFREHGYGQPQLVGRQRKIRHDYAPA